MAAPLPCRKGVTRRLVQDSKEERCFQELLTPAQQVCGWCMAGLLVLGRGAGMYRTLIQATLSSVPNSLILAPVAGGWYQCF